jgi:hypothetical protein
MNARPRVRLLAAFGLALVASCGGGGGYGGGGSGGGNASPGGVWNGTDSISGLQVVGLVDESGDAHFIRSDGVQYVGSAVTAGNSLSATFDGYAPVGATFADGSTHGTGTLTGTIAARVTINANTTFRTDKGSEANGTLYLTFNPIYNQASSLAIVAGNYTLAGTNVVVTISANGALFSQDPATGCVVNGTVTVINASYNAYGVSADYASCTGAFAGLNGVALHGLATFDSNVAPAQLIAGVNGSNGLVPYAIVYTLDHS